MRQKRLFAVQAQFLEPLDATCDNYLFGLQGFFTTDPKNLEYINNTKFEDFELGSRRLGCLPFLGDGIFCQDGPAWKHSRDILKRQFMRVQYNDLSTLEPFVESFVSSFAGAKSVVDIQPACFNFTLSTTTALLFGEPVDDLGVEKTKDFAYHFDYASEKTALRLRLSDLHFLHISRTFTKSCDAVRAYADYFVGKAMRARTELGEKEAFAKYPFIIDLYGQVGNAQKVRDQLINVLLAGRDTTACTMSWAIFMLVRHPEKLARLRAEIYEATDGKTNFTRGHLQRMPYLAAVIKETLRLYPQIPINNRNASRTTWLPRGGGADGLQPIMIRKGQGIGYSTYHMHRRKEYYGEDAEDFRPERWLTDELVNIGSAYVPFHSGPRICLGKDFAFTESSYAIARFVQAYPNLRLPEGTKVVPVGQEPQNLTIVVSSAEGCKVSLD
ncbi:hypothetical protein LTS08_000422 [Lithohypha guttulata]|nr:hypothetical protein LTS08_000422 [Lithohypha guttulata]